MAAASHRILLVDDEEDILEFLEYNLFKEGYIVEKANNGLEAIQCFSKFQPDLILMDVMMPEMNGIQACREIRSLQGGKLPIVAFLTARDEDLSQIEGFEAGGDDYINKPLKPRVLMKRIAALLSRKRDIPPRHSQLSFENLQINFDKHEVKSKGKNVKLSKKEFNLLLLLSSQPGKVFSRQEIFKTVWDQDVIVGDRTIDVHIRKLREKLGEEVIETIKGRGYKFAL